MGFLWENIRKRAFSRISGAVYTAVARVLELGIRKSLVGAASLYSCKGRR